MIYPKFIKPGDCIGITATSKGNGDELHIRKHESAVSSFEEKGYRVIETPDVRTDFKKRSAPKEIRAQEFMSLIENKDVNAIITTRGGEFLLEIIPYIDFEKIMKNPKWIQGYSDTTGLSFCITTICDIATIYGENFATFSMRPWHKSLYDSLDLLEGKRIENTSYDKYRSKWQEEITGLEPYILDADVEWKNGRGEKQINLEGRLIGGCIDCLHSIVGTRFDNVPEYINKYKEDGIIWFFDIFGLSSEEIFCTLWQLREAGWFKHCKGIIFGRPYARKTCADISLEESVMDVLGELNVPIIFDSDIGHVAPQMPIINGAKAKIESKDGKGKIEFILE